MTDISTRRSLADGESVVEAAVAGADSMNLLATKLLSMHRFERVTDSDGARNSLPTTDRNAEP